MDATRITAATLFCGVLLTTGCSLLQPPTRPSRQQSPNPPPSREPVIVHAASTQPVSPSRAAAIDPIEQRVMEYIDRVEKNSAVSGESPAGDASILNAGHAEPTAAPAAAQMSLSTLTGETPRVLVPQKRAARDRQLPPRTQPPRESHPAAPPPDAALAADENASPTATPGRAARDAGANAAPPRDRENVESAHSAAEHATPPPADEIHDPAAPHAGSRRSTSASEPQSSASERATITSEPPPPVAEPPILESVTVRPAESAIQPAAAPKSAEPAVNVPARAAGAGPSATDLLGAYMNDPEWRSDASFRRQLDAKLLAVIAGDLDTARKPLDMATGEQQALATRLVSALIAARDSHAGDARGSADRVLSELDALGDTLRKTTSLELPRLAICREVRGFGQFQPFDPAQFAAGQVSEFVLYCELRNFMSQPQPDGQYLSKFEMRTTILHGKESVLELVDRDITDRCRSPRRDCFIPRVVRLPPTLAPGRYLAKVAIIDKLGDKVAEQTAEFRLTAQ